MTSSLCGSPRELATNNADAVSESSCSRTRSSLGPSCWWHPRLGAQGAASFRPEIEIDGTSTRVLVEQVGAVDVNRLGDLAGHLAPEDQWGVDAALLTVLGLD